MFGNIFNQSTPGQLYHVNFKSVETTLAEPLESLSSAVFYYWLMHIDDGGCCLEVIPDGALDLVVAPGLPGFSAVYTPVIKKFTISLEGPACYAGISFEPEAAQQYLGMDMDLLSALEQGSATTEALNLEGLVNDIQNVTDICHVKDIFDKELCVKNVQPTRRLQQSAYECFVEELSAGKAQNVAQRIGISERQFRRTMHDISGLAPKQVQRIVRLQQLLHELFKAEKLELDDGFYDDSHRIRELKELLGMTYGELREMAEIYNRSK